MLTREELLAELKIAADTIEALLCNPEELINEGDYAEAEQTLEHLRDIIGAG